MTPRLNLLRIHRDVSSKTFPFLAFITPLAVRAIPEFLMGKYIVGFDTISYYVPVILRWIGSGIDIWEFIGCAPLLYSLLATLTLIGVPLTVSLKILPPFIHGLLGLTVYLYAKKGLAWPFRKSLFVSLLATLYFVTLRISWDMLRCELGLIFLFTFLIVLHNCSNSSQWKSFGMLSVCMVLVVLAHQLVAVLMFVMVLAVVLKRLASHSYDKVKGLILASMPAAALFMLVAYACLVVLPSIHTSFAGSRIEWLILFGYSSVYEGMTNTLGFLIYCYIPLLPFAYVGIKRWNCLELRVWTVWCLAAVSFPFFIPSMPVGYRWILLLAFPMAFFTIEGLQLVNSSYCKGIWAASLLLLSFSFIFLPAETAFPYYTIFPYYIPSSMLENSVPLSDCADVVKVLRWIESNAEKNSHTTLLVHAAFHGWALLYSDNSNIRIVNYGYADPEEAAEVALEGTHSKAYAIWWVSGEGWHGLASLPSTFIEVYRSGRIAVYEFEASV